MMQSIHQLNQGSNEDSTQSAQPLSSMKPKHPELHSNTPVTQFQPNIQNDQSQQKDLSQKVPSSHSRQQNSHHHHSQKCPNIETSSSNVEKNMMECMMKLVDFHTAPDVDIDVYAGDPLEYEYFRATFKEVVERRIHDESGRLIRLLKFTSGDAKELIKHCIHEKEDECYTNAISLLEKEYGNKQLVINSYLDKLRSWPKIQSNDAKAYKKLYRYLLLGKTHKKDGKLTELDSDTVIRAYILSKMDKSVQEKWLSKVVRNRERKKPELAFEDLVDFVEHLSLLASEPSFSQQAYRSDSKSSDFKNFGINVRATHCILCDGVHLIEDCKEFKEMKVNERANYIYSNKSCFNCSKDIGPDHLAQNCKLNVKCNICKENHNTLMHGNE